MMFRQVADLREGDAVRPFDDRLWRVAAIGDPDERGREPVAPGRVAVTFAHPVDGPIEVEACQHDMVRLA
jgi:hypothetical protein